MLGAAPKQHAKIATDLAVRTDVLFTRFTYTKAITVTKAVAVTRGIGESSPAAES